VIVTDKIGCLHLLRCWNWFKKTYASH